MVGRGPLAFATDGAVYFAGQTGGPFEPDVFRFTAPHEGALFDTLPENVRSMVGDDAGSLFVLTTDGVYRYQAGAPESRQLLAPLMASAGAMTISGDGNSLYVIRGNLVSVDVETGQVMPHGFPPTPQLFGALHGAAVFVPEPAGVALFGILTALVFLRRRER